jgi:hypothetical protein
LFYIINTSMRIFISSIIVVLLFICLFFIVGFIAPTDFQKSKSTLFEDRQSTVWTAILDIEQYINRKKDIQRVEIVERRFGSIRKWIEYYPLNEVLEYEIIRQESPTVFTISVKDEYRKIYREVEYFIEQQTDKTKLTVSEVSRAEDLFWRGVTTLFGRDNFIDKQLKWIRVALFEELLDDI